MATILKCPNPSCPFQFDASRVPPGAVIACPQCRLTFTLSPTAAPPPAAAPQDTFETTDDSPRRRKVIDRSGLKGARSNASLLVAFMAVGTVALVGGAVAGLGFLLGWFKPAAPVLAAGGLTFDEYAIGFPKPLDGWNRDETTRAALGVNLFAYRTSAADGEGWVAADAKRFTSAARASELRLAVNEKLRKQFDELDEDITGEEAPFLGQPGERFRFRGVYRPTQAGCRGEVFACVVKNHAYWLYAWAPEAGYDKLAAAFEAFRTGIKVQVPVGKGGTTPPPADGRMFRTKSGLFTLTDTEKLWAEGKDPTSQDKDAELWLRGTGRSASTGQPSTDKADLVVAVLAPDGGAKEQAQAHILKQVIEGAMAQELQGDPTGDAPPGGEVKSDAVTRLKLTYLDGPTANKLVVFGTLDVDGKRVVAYALCPLRQSNYWEQRLMQIVGTLKAGK
jgi:hypothetical protein